MIGLMVVMLIVSFRRSYSSKVCGVPLDDWTNGGSVDRLLQVWSVGVGASSLGIWSYSNECV